MSDSHWEHGTIAVIITALHRLWLPIVSKPFTFLFEKFMDTAIGEATQALFSKFKRTPKKKEHHMAKKNVVTFTKGETPAPRKLASGLIGLRTPIAFTVAPDAEHKLKLDIASDAVLFLNDGGFVPSGQNITLLVRNTSGATVEYQPGDVVARALPIFFTEYEVG